MKIKEIKEKTDLFMKNLLKFLIIITGYIFVPQIVGSIIYLKIGLSETVSLFIGNISYALILLIVYRKMFLEKLKDYKQHFASYFGLSLKYWGISLAVLFVSNLILSCIFNGNISANETAVRSFVNGNLIIGAISVVLVAPLVEEMVFRYGLRKPFGNIKIFPLISALCFGLPHALTDITSVLELLYIIPYSALGYAFGYIYNKTDNILCTVNMHMLHNLSCIIIMLLPM